ncbi:hypothetical protein TNCV_3485141 [Trichonephila clavipes]|nr:hypothetical protein TNCV_3485141 [Trichonephila clavipes]
MRRSSHNCLDDSLRERYVGRLEAGHCQEEEECPKEPNSPEKGLELQIDPSGNNHSYNNNFQTHSLQTSSRDWPLLKVSNCVSICLHPTGKAGYYGAKSISHGHLKNEGVFFSTMSQDSPDRVILIESSSGVIVKLVFIPPTL